MLMRSSDNDRGRVLRAAVTPGLLDRRAPCPARGSPVFGAGVPPGPSPDRRWCRHRNVPPPPRNDHSAQFHRAVRQRDGAAVHRTQPRRRPRPTRGHAQTVAADGPRARRRLLLDDREHGQRGRLHLAEREPAWRQCGRRQQQHRLSCAPSAPGMVYGAAEPIHRGRRQQLWLVTITDDDDRVVARGQVRLQNLEASRGDKLRCAQIFEWLTDSRAGRLRVSWPAWPPDALPRPPVPPAVRGGFGRTPAAR